jgi:hypothetical protein
MGQTPDSPPAPTGEAEVTPPAGAPDPTIEPTGTPDAPPDPRVTSANKEAAKYRKELRETQAELEKFRDAQKTEAEKLAERAQKAEADRANLLRRAVAAELGLPADLAERLRGDDEDELKADAEALKALLAPTPTPSNEPATPVVPAWPDAPQGPRGGSAVADPAAATAHDLLSLARKARGGT